ncbi:MAG: hypothetical protein IID37_07600 [Planctomycetes bacterium]|nr:hypothetical protein [Planctomycetota bacterium]
MKVRDLRVTLASTFKSHGLEGLEHCFVSKRRNVRLLGQEYVYPVDVQPDGTFTLVDPALTPKEQFFLTVDLIEDHPLSSLSALVKSAQDAPEDAQVESGDIKKRKGGLGSFKRVDASESIVSACTFTRVTKNRICPKATTCRAPNASCWLAS